MDPVASHFCRLIDWLHIEFKLTSLVIVWYDPRQEVRDIIKLLESHNGISEIIKIPRCPRTFLGYVEQS